MMMLFGKGGGVGAGDEEKDDGFEEKGDTGAMQTSVDCN